MELLSVPVILAIIEALKQSGMDSKYAPALSILFGILFGLSFVSLDLSGLAVGIMAGLGASGLWSGGKSTIKTLTE